jgi:PilZ domain
MFQVKEEPAKPLPRSSRFLIHAPMRYRIRGEGPWKEGITVNISDSGVLFEGEADVGPGTRVEFHISLPGDSGTTGCIICSGLIVRETEQPLLAARFIGPRLHRP